MEKDTGHPPDEIQDKFKTGSITEFDSIWLNLPESYRYHFKRGNPENQIQYAFQNHWRVFNKVIQCGKGGKALEVGCGRGSMAAFFADDHYETHLLDTSHSALQLAKANFSRDNLDGNPVVGDALLLPYKNAAFDVIFSIGLFEHFAKIETPLREQIRVLKEGGTFLGYIVPERWLSAQLLGIPINFFLKVEHSLKQKGEKKGSSDHHKESLFRNSFTARDYRTLLKNMGLQETGSFGLFPVPMISHSYKFPFTLMAPPRERALVKFWDSILNMRFWSADPWICAERWGLAFLVWARK
jgi:ubiquinone/menaquinone biosynthesis C-methylase UbiE